MPSEPSGPADAVAGAGVPATATRFPATATATQFPAPATATPLQAPATGPTSPSAASVSSREPGEFTLALAGDVNFAGRTADLLARDPATALHQAKDELDTADITMVNLETAITTGGTPAPKQFHFRTPATALTALSAAGVDVATMANNHAVDYGPEGLSDTLAAIAHGPVPVIGIGDDAAQAYSPYTATVNGVRVAIIAASQVHDWTLGSWAATATSPGIANADSDLLVAAVRDARERADVVVVYLHWGIEYQDCPSRIRNASRRPWRRRERRPWWAPTPTCCWVPGGGPTGPTSHTASATTTGGGRSATSRTTTGY